MRNIFKSLPILGRFISREDGIVSIEFAVWMTLLSGLFLTGLEYGLHHKANINLTKAVNTGTIIAFSKRDNVDPVELKTVITDSYKRDISNKSSNNTAPSNTGPNNTGSINPNFVVEVQCNGDVASCTETIRKCACISTPNGNSTPIFTEQTCNTPCSSGGEAGFFMTIDVSAKAPRLFNTPISPPETISTRSTIRLE